jgi:hypothetical protein
MSSAVHPDPGPSSPRSSMLPDRRHVPLCLDTTSEFFQVLTAPYQPPVKVPSLRRTKPRPDQVERCRATINWTPAMPTETTSHASTSSQPPSQLDQPIYRPHGRWAWTHGLPFDDPKQLLSLRKGAQCAASIDSGTVAGKDIKYICRKWKMSKQKEWHGFYSEVCPLRSVPSPGPTSRSLPCTSQTNTSGHSKGMSCPTSSVSM